MGLIMDPCGAYVSKCIVVDNEPFILTFTLRLVRKLDIHLINIMGKLSLVNFSLSSSCYIVSKAFWISKAAITLVKLRLCMTFSIGVSILKR